MRWTSKKRKTPSIGDWRYRNGFLLIPKRIGNEWRWWERASWVEECKPFTCHVPECGSFDSWKWTAIRWANI